MVNEKLRDELLSLLEQDRRTREQLASTGELFEAYHPKMEEVHKKNARRLVEIYEEYGWPGKGLVGEDGAEAAWIIFQHNIGEPEMFRRFLPILENEAEKREIEPSWYAKTVDRIRVFEGKPQIYGTNFDWDEGGNLSPWPIENPETVNNRRKKVGLPPIKEDIARTRREAQERGEKPPRDFEGKRKQMEEWARKVGWRK